MVFEVFDTCMCCVPLWNMCHPETCFRLAWCAILKNVHFWNMSQIGTVHTSSYRSRMLNARSWSIKMCAKKPHVRQAAFCLFVCFSVINAGLLQMQWVLLSALDMTKFARCQSVTCFRNTHFSERHTRLIWNMFQDMFHNGKQHVHVLRVLVILGPLGTYVL